MLQAAESELGAELVWSAFRKPGFFLSASHSVALEKKTPTAVCNEVSLLAKPANFRDVHTRFVGKFGEPNRRDLSGVGVSFVSVASSDVRPATYDDAWARHEAGEGDLIDIGLDEVRTYVHVQSDTTWMSYTRWLR